MSISSSETSSRQIKEKISDEISANSSIADAVVVKSKKLQEACDAVGWTTVGPSVGPLHDRGHRRGGGKRRKSSKRRSSRSRSRRRR